MSLGFGLVWDVSNRGSLSLEHMFHMRCVCAFVWQWFLFNDDVVFMWCLGTSQQNTRNDGYCKSTPCEGFTRKTWSTVMQFIFFIMSMYFFTIVCSDHRTQSHSSHFIALCLNEWYSMIWFIKDMSSMYLPHSVCCCHSHTPPGLSNSHMLFNFAHMLSILACSTWR